MFLGNGGFVRYYRTNRGVLAPEAEQSQPVKESKRVNISKDTKPGWNWLHKLIFIFSLIQAVVGDTLNSDFKFCEIHENRAVYRDLPDSCQTPAVLNKQSDRYYYVLKELTYPVRGTGWHCSMKQTTIFTHMDFGDGSRLKRSLNTINYLVPNVIQWSRRKNVWG